MFSWLGPPSTAAKHTKHLPRPGPASAPGVPEQTPFLLPGLSCPATGHTAEGLHLHMAPSLVFFSLHVSHPSVSKQEVSLLSSAAPGFGAAGLRVTQDDKSTAIWEMDGGTVALGKRPCWLKKPGSQRQKPGSQE